MTIGAKAGGSMLFVRSLADLHRALRGVNELLARRRSLGSAGEDVLGILVREDLDSGIPTPTYAGARAPGDDVALRDTVALCGIWSLCSFDFTFPDTRADAEHRRRRLLEFLVTGCKVGGSAQDKGSLLLPVLTCAEARKEVNALVDDLKTRCPTLAVGRDCFVHDPEQREFMRLAADDLPSEVRRLS